MNCPHFRGYAASLPAEGAHAPLGAARREK
jgi:hypothetical protein